MIQNRKKRHVIQSKDSQFFKLFFVIVCWLSNNDEIKQNWNEISTFWFHKILWVFFHTFTCVPRSETHYHQINLCLRKYTTKYSLFLISVFCQILSRQVVMGLNTFIALIITVIGLVAYWFKKKFSYWENRGFKFITPEFPFGSLKGVGFKIHFSQKSAKFYNDYKNKAKAIGLYFFTAPVVLVTELDTVKHILVKDFSSFHDRGLYFNKQADPLSGHLFALEGEF